MGNKENIDVHASEGEERRGSQNGYRNTRRGFIIRTITASLHVKQP